MIDVQVERAVEQLNEKVDDLVLRPQVFSTRLEEHLERLRGEQQQLAESVSSLRDAVARLAAAGSPGSGGVADKLQPTVQTPRRAASDLLQAAVQSPGTWAAIGAFLGTTAAVAIVRSRHS